jgi:predicted flap endonuclease-1-like 5' DNA nuclease
MDAPTRDGAYEVAKLISQRELYVMEHYRSALRKVERQTGWVHVFSRVEGFVQRETVCQDHGQPVVLAKASETVKVWAEAATGSEALMELNRSAMVSVLERDQEWLRIRVIIPGYADASLIEPVARADIRRCFGRRLRVRGKARSSLRSAPCLERSFEVARLDEAGWLTVMEDEARALSKVSQETGWLLVQTAVEGYVETGCLVGQEEEALIHVADGGQLEVFELPQGKGAVRLVVSHPARVKVLAREGAWVKVEVRAQGYYQGAFAREQNKTAGAQRVDRPLVGASEVPVPDCAGPPEFDDLQLVEGIGPKVTQMLHEAGVYTFEQLRDAPPSVREIQRLVNEQGWYYMQPDTWPQQAGLLAAAKARGEDPASSPEYLELVKRLKGGREMKDDD